MSMNVREQRRHKLSYGPNHMEQEIDLTRLERIISHKTESQIIERGSRFLVWRE